MDSPTWLRDGALRLVERTLNRVLMLDPDTPVRLAPLIGRRLEVSLTEPAATLAVTFEPAGLRLRAVPVPEPLDEGNDPTRPDARLRAPLAGLLALAASRGRRSRDVVFEGDVGVIQEVRHLFLDLEVDWEEPLATMLGDVFAHQAGNVARGGAAWSRRAGATFLTNLGEYLTEERRLLPTSSELGDFLADVDRLRADGDRLEARLRRLEGRRRGEGT